MDWKDKWRSIEEYLLFLRSLKAYDFAKGYAVGKNVLDLGCGAGYGAYLLSDVANIVIGVDINRQVIEYASKKYRADNLRFELIDPTNYSQGTKFDLITCFQVLEHINNTGRRLFLESLRASICQGGVILISTPNRLKRLLPFQKPWNPDHAKEYSPDELKNLLQSHFQKIQVGGIKGKKDINRIEKRRVRRNALSAFGKGNFPLRLYEFARCAKKMLGEISGRRCWQSSKAKNPKKIYSLDDYELLFSSEKNELLDLIAVCRL